MAFNASKDLADQYATGKWEEFRGGKFKIAMAGNPLFHMASRRLEREYKEKYGEAMNAQVELEMQRRQIAEGLLLDWEEVEGEDGQPVPYSVEAAADLLGQSMALYEFVQVKALEYDKLYREDIQAQGKKPQKLSNTG